MAIKPLGKVKELVESVGMAVSYAYEDLVFLEQNAFFLQFGQDENSLIVHRNEEASPREVARIISEMEKAATRHGFTLVLGNIFKMRQAEGETISIEFHG